MDDSHKNSPGASLPLPPEGAKSAPTADSTEPAVELIRKKVAAAYGQEPDVVIEAEELEELGPAVTPSKHQKFIEQLTGSGKPLQDIQVEWRDYYMGLTDTEKHQAWREFYNVHAQASNFSASAPPMAPGQPEVTPKKSPPVAPARPVRSKTTELVNKSSRIASDRLRSLPKTPVHRHLKSLGFGLSMGCLAILILLFGFFNERFIAPFIQPSRNVSNIPLIDANTISDASEVIIPKINVEIPVIYGVNTIDEQAVESALEDGVVHYADTAMPGQDGNLVIVGHSSNNIFNQGKYKFAFVLLPRLEIGDTFYIQKDGKRYTYQVYQKKIVSPDDVSVLGPTDKDATASLITCYPPGTSNNRMVIIGQQISPDPSANVASSGNNSLATQSTIIPGNSPTLWSRIWSWL